MAAKRVPLGLTWEQHQHFASRLHDIWELVYRPDREKKAPRLCGRLYDLVFELAHEMAEFIYLDLKETPYNPRRDDPYDGWAFSDTKPSFDFNDARDVLHEFREMLLPKNQNCAAMKHINAMLSAMDKAGV